MGVLDGKTIVFGVTGGIAAYKSCEAVSRLKKLGATVCVIMTKNATEFVAPMTFETLSNQPCVVDTFARPERWEVEHVSLAKRADLFVFSPRAHADTLPPGFATYGPILKAEQRAHWPDHPDPAALAALVEQESCASRAACWNPGARLKTSREEGVGMGQITRAYRADGSLRFDALAGLRDQYGADLSGLSWDTVYSRPDLHLRAVVLMSRDAARPFRGSTGWLHFGDAGYNGGVAGVQKERRACKLSAGCDPARWFGHVEAHCLKSRQPLYGGRSACDINREHVRNVFLVRRTKYVGAMS